MESLVFLIYIVAFLLAVMLHEIAHGFVANYFGDDTARISGRLSLNPLVHLDLFGSILVPLILFISNAGFLFGWAKPVPVNPYRLRGGTAAYRWVTVAGVLTNLVLAIFAALVLKIVTQYLDIGANNLGVVFFKGVLEVNIVLAIFNALPLPGFDGFNFLLTFRPIVQILSQTPLANPFFLARYGLLISIFLLFLFMSFISQILNFIFNLFIKFFGL